MGMERCIVPSILLMLALQSAALLVAGDVGAILLPSKGQVADEAAMAAAKKRPWKCCDKAFCTRSIPPICRCMDELFECPSTCKSCGPSMADPSRLVCQDQYVGDPGPICRPWECCDLPRCTRSNPPTCQCLDEVDKCSPTCKTCLPSRSRPSRRVCIDSYFGPFPPACTPKAVAAGGN
ncbi:Bowman-Birk type trypsin inhibitor-like isoform X1 [Triticum dicoccoides]|uniref:Bowman-Birk type trypsin inhibitor-like isoform X1 n=1 Tax=Triticum dicoccoides TaxID=85692 RepID=UPI000E7BAEC4|nr:Bowman-Birk type trypsin inhibitor-like isoform X1 [Triticum dicoccoides]